MRSSSFLFVFAFGSVCVGACSSGVDQTRALSSLSAQERKQACSDWAGYVDGVLSTSDVLKAMCNVQSRAAADCKSTYAQCTAQPINPNAHASTVVGNPAACENSLSGCKGTASVAEWDKCIHHLAAMYKNLAANGGTCTEKSSVSIPDSCITVQRNCMTAPVDAGGG